MAQTDIQAGQASRLILAGMAVLGLTDNLLAFITATSSLWQFHLIRGSLVVLAALVLSVLLGSPIRPKRLVAVLARSAFIAGAMIIYFGCLALLPIGVVVAGLFTSPLFVLILTAVFQRRRVGPVRWGAVCLGFVGALLVIRPDPAALDPIAFLPIVAGLLYAIGAVATRAWCEGESTLTLTAFFFGLLALSGALGVALLPAGAEGAEGFPIRGWMPLSPDILFWTGAQAIGALIGIGFIFRAYLVGEASYVAVFEYSLLIFASAWGWVLWGQAVPVTGIVGMVFIAGAGIIIARRSEQASA